MASITSMVNGSSSLSSIYGSRNVLSGLASGMDTESMIENAISGIKTKIQNLVKKRTKVEWQQEAYRSIIDKAANFNQKYTSYSSKTNLLSQSFFNNAVNTTTNGTYKDKVTASGKTSSDIKINAVKQLATAASYTVSGQGTPLSEIDGAVRAGNGMDITGKTSVSTVSGSLTFQYGGTNGSTFSIKFDDLENLDEMEGMEGKSTAEKLAKAIENKLSEVTYNYTKNGFQESTTADKAIKVSVDNGTIKFSDGLGNGNKISISSVSGNIEKTLGISKDDKSIDVGVGYDAKKLVEDKDTSEYLADKSLSVTLNGTTKTISMKDVLGREGAADSNEKFAKALQAELDDAFGKGKVKVGQAAGEGGETKLSFSTEEGSTLSVNGTAAEGLGFSKGDSNYINAGKKLSELLGDKGKDVFTDANRVKGQFDSEESKPIEKTSPNGTTYYVDDAGNRVDEKGFRIDKDGKALYDFQVNGTHINVTEDTTLDSLINSINSNSDAGVKVSYSKLTNEFKFTATETGSNGKIEFGGLGKDLFGTVNTQEYSQKVQASAMLGKDYDFGEDGEETFKLTLDGKEFSMHITSDESIDDIVKDINVVLHEFGVTDNGNEKWTARYDAESKNLVFEDAEGNRADYTYEDGVAKDLFNAVKKETGYTAGQDAIMDVEVNGKRFENLSRSTNSFDLDGLTVNVKGTFEAVGKDGEDYEPITFTTSTDSDKIIDTIREFVNDYNEMATEIKNAYSTLPAQKSNGARYEPLTAEEEDGYSESERKAYEEKAKQGILFGDSTLTSMYSKLLNAIQPGGTDGQTLREIGIGTSYENGMTTLSLDEDKLRAALDSDPEKVKNAFTKTKEGGASSNGLMQTLQNSLNTYVKTTGEPKGVLIQRAGSVKAPTSLNSNSLKSQIDSYDNQIERWQTKMSNQIDRYTTQFSRLEQLIAEMNSQASAFSGLMGGSTGY